MSHLRVPSVVTLTMVLAAGSACAPSAEDARARPSTGSATADAGWTVQSVPMPDLSRLPQSVQTQVRDRYAALAATSASSKMPSEELAQAHGDVGLILMATGYHAAAETSLRNAQALAPREAKWPYYLGQLFLLTSDRVNTLKSFERALELRPMDLPTIVRLGEAYLDQRRIEDAERLFRRAREIDSRSAAAFEGLGRVAQARGDQARAVEYLEQTLTLDPQATRVHYPLAQSYRALGQQEKAEVHLKLRGDGRPDLYDPLMQAFYWLVDSAEAHYQRGVLAMQAGKWDAAADLFRKGLALDPENAQLGYSLGLALYWKGDHDSAEKQFEAVLRRSPDHLETRFNLAVLLAQQKRYREALTHFAAVAKQEPGRADAQVGQAEMLRNLGDLNASVLHWRRAVEIDSSNAVAWAEGAKALFALKRYREAREWLEAAQKVHPEHPELESIRQTIDSALAHSQPVRR
jgi:tetratricopeptide (TPR) repeat protein